MDEDNFIPSLFSRKHFNFFFADSELFGKEFYKGLISLALYRRGRNFYF